MAFLAFVDKLLVRYLDGPYSDPATRIRIKVIQQRLRPYLNEIPTHAAPTAPERTANAGRGEPSNGAARA